jgi:DHA1 family multidrug resistance protein-like MFS transporter
MMKRKRNLILFTAAVFLFWFSQYAFLPTLPEYLRGKVGNLAVVGAILAMYGLGMVVVRLPLGILIDAVGRQKVFLFGGFLVSAVGSLALGAGGTIPALYIGRSFTGLAQGIWVPLVVVFSGFFPPEQSVRTTALLTLVTAAARILATAFNGYLNEWSGPGLAFYVATAAAVLAAILVLPVPLDSRPAGAPKLRPLMRVFVRKDVLLPSVLGAINQYVLFGISLGFMPVLAGRLGAGNVALGYLAMVNLLFFLLGNLTATSSSYRFRSGWLVLASYVLFAAALVTAALSKSLPLLFIAQGCIGLAHGIGYPVLMGMTIRDVPAHSRSSAMGLHQSVYAAGIFIGPWASGALAEALGIRPMFGLTAALVLVLGASGAIVLSRFSSPQTARPAGRRATRPGKGTNPPDPDPPWECR